jgi:hypothetical protein
MRNSILPLIALTVSGCGIAPLQMEINPALAHIEPFAVAGNNPRRFDRPISFGRWRTLAVDEGSARHDSNPILSTRTEPNLLSATQSSQAYRFKMLSDRASLFAECKTQSSALTATQVKGKTTDVTQIVTAGDPSLNCLFSGTAGGSLRLSTISAMTSEREEGEVFFADAKWSIRSVNHFQGERIHSSRDRFGYEVLAGTQFIGAVETANSGRVWIDPSLATDQQDRLAVVIAALLLYQPEKLESDDP